MNPEFHYLAFGLRISSEFALPELPEVETDGPSEFDVEIRAGFVSPSLDGGSAVGPGVVASGASILLDYPPARYLIRSGREIVVQPAPGCSERDLRAYLLGSAMGAIVHERGSLPLHANAIEIDGRAIAFAGPSGSGKSTLAARFQQLGYEVLCDDVCVVTFDASGLPLAWPGVPRIKLWADALARFGPDSSGLDRTFDGEDKFSVPTSRSTKQGPIPLARVYILNGRSRLDAVTITRLTGAAATDAIVENTYRWEFAAPLGKAKVQFDNVIGLLSRCEIYAARRSWGYRHFKVGADELVRHLEHRNG